MNDYGFSFNENKDGTLNFDRADRLTQHHLLLGAKESSVLEQLSKDMDMSTQGVLKQALRVLQMYRAGYLADNSPKSGGCDA
jgi:hypothetical protein